MNKSNIISEKLKQLEKESCDLFSILRNKRPIYDFLGKLDFDKEGLTTIPFLVDLADEQEVLEELPIVEMRSDLDGGTFDVHVLRVDENGLTCVNYNDHTVINTYGFNDLSNIDYRLIVLNEMYEIDN